MTDALKLGDLDGMDLPDFTAQAVVVPKGSVSTLSTSVISLLWIPLTIRSDVNVQMRIDVLSSCACDFTHFQADE